MGRYDEVDALPTWTKMESRGIILIKIPLCCDGITAKVKYDTILPKLFTGRQFLFQTPTTIKHVSVRTAAGNQGCYLTCALDSTELHLVDLPVCESSTFKDTKHLNPLCRSQQPIQ